MGPSRRIRSRHRVVPDLFGDGSETVGDFDDSTAVDRIADSSSDSRTGASSVTGAIDREHHDG